MVEEPHCLRRTRWGLLSRSCANYRTRWSDWEKRKHKRTTNESGANMKNTGEDTATEAARVAAFDRARRIVQNAIAASIKGNSTAKPPKALLIPPCIFAALREATPAEKAAVMRPAIDWMNGKAYTRPAGVLGWMFDEIKRETEQGKGV